MDPYLVHGLIAAATSAIILSLFCWFASRRLRKEFAKYNEKARRCEDAVAKSEEVRKDLHDSIRRTERACLNPALNGSRH